MDEELIRKYQDAIALLQFRNPEYSYHGEFVDDYLGRKAFKLIYYKRFDDSTEPHGWARNRCYSKTFKYMNNSAEAIKYFIKVAQNRVF